MTYDELTDEQKADLHAHEIYMRNNCNQLLRMINLADKNSWDEFIATRVNPVLDSLNNNETIPNTSGLANSKDFMALDYKALKNALAALYELQQQSNALIVQAGGTGNV